MLRPDTYIGSVEFDKQNLYVFNAETHEIEFREVTYVPGLYKIFGKCLHVLNLCLTCVDEILVNAADNF